MSSSKPKPKVTSKHSSIVFAMQERPTMSSSKKHSPPHAASTQPSPKETIQQILQTKYNITVTSFPKYDTVPDHYFVRSAVLSSSSLKNPHRLMTAVRDNDIKTIRHLHEVLHIPLQCANQFQESIVHTVARRGYTEMLQYLMNDAQISVRVCCDGGRNALHDACWTTTPNFHMIQLFVQNSPDLLYLCDQRNFTPLDYIPKDAYAVWNTWLQDHDHLLKPQVLNFQ
jgi:hypothetical protein